MVLAPHSGASAPNAVLRQSEGEAGVGIVTRRAETRAAGFGGAWGVERP